MSVYTHVHDEHMRQLLTQYDIGTFQSLHGIAQGITNSNYFLYTDRDSFVLTIFEALTQAELPFFLKLTQHLNQNGVACPNPIAQTNGRLDAQLLGKPACIVSRLKGSDTAYPTPEQCFNTGAMLATMHIASIHFPEKMPNPRHTTWWTNSAEQLYPILNQNDRKLLRDEIEFLSHYPDQHLPAGIIHADLFKDNVLLDGNKVAGFIDFYYACNGSFVYDLAIAINDWARHANNTLDIELQLSFMQGYESVRPLTDDERAYLNIAHRAACVRFWVSRLLDYHFPNTGELTFIKDPNVFRDLLISFH